MARFGETSSLTSEDRDTAPSHPSLLFPKLATPGTGEKQSSFLGQDGE